ncbi:shikimate dehydrogenase [[Phormidium ambiguum] IAM M-71]|uniref:Shikimate dehydrogenase (NADP(+)) n=1 Tax=[Phormidium ambiguum] IAM M-71 TaxID=454136 RepID=A0A1U7IJ05_9CYAN|nr:shikimate dehydrogenase [Phormidium ambiguum]OKH37104.1 shikimate dehydrogenase [Phormidium ambiguum IAM M-71]
MITGKTKLLGVIGDPIEHSLSPVMHNAAIAKLQLDYVYLPFPIKAEDLPAAIAGFAAIDLIGFSVTIPHKQAIIPLLTEVSPIAKAIGAVNTVWRTETGWSGTNTDVEGFLSPLKNYNQNWSQTTTLILGCGGAARAVVAGCTQLNCGKIQVVGRDPQKLKAFQNSWQNSQLAVNLSVHNWQELPDLIGESKLLVNTTPVGMYPHVDRSPVNAELMEKLPINAIAYDLIYTPNPTKFLQIAKEQGAEAIDGLEMLVQQGAAALQIWLKQQAPVEVMRQSLQKYLGLI